MAMSVARAKGKVTKKDTTSAPPAFLFDTILSHKYIVSVVSMLVHLVDSFDDDSHIHIIYFLGKYSSGISSG